MNFLLFESRLYIVFFLFGEGRWFVFGRFEGKKMYVLDLSSIVENNIYLTTLNKDSFHNIILILLILHTK